MREESATSCWPRVGALVPHSGTKAPNESPLRRDQVGLPRRRGARRGDSDEDRGARRAGPAAGMHADLLGEAVSLLAVAGRAGGDDVLPDRLATPAPRDDVVDGEAGLVRSAVL